MLICAPQYRVDCPARCNGLVSFVARDISQGSASAGVLADDCEKRLAGCVQYHRGTCHLQSVLKYPDRSLMLANIHCCVNLSAKKDTTQMTGAVQMLSLPILSH